MSNSSKKLWTSGELARRWEVHRASVPRIMFRFGISGVKFGSAKQAARRFTEEEIALVEKLAGFSKGWISSADSGERRDSIRRLTRSHDDGESKMDAAHGPGGSQAVGSRRPTLPFH